MMSLSQVMEQRLTISSLQEALVESKETCDLLRAQLNQDVSAQPSSHHKQPFPNHKQPFPNHFATNSRHVTNSCYSVGNATFTSSRNALVNDSKFTGINRSDNFNGSEGSNLIDGVSNRLSSEKKSNTTSHLSKNSNGSADSVVFSLASATSHEIIDNNVFPYYKNAASISSKSSQDSSPERSCRALPYAVNSEQYAKNNEQYAKNSEQYAKNNEQYPKNSEQYAKNNEQYAKSAADASYRPADSNNTGQCIRDNKYLSLFNSTSNKNDFRMNGSNSSLPLAGKPLNINSMNDFVTGNLNGLTKTVSPTRFVVPGKKTSAHQGQIFDI